MPQTLQPDRPWQMPRACKLEGAADAAARPVDLVAVEIWEEGTGAEAAEVAGVVASVATPGLLAVAARVSEGTGSEAELAAADWAVAD